MNCNHPSTITVADCWIEERNDAGMNCYECEECGILLEKHPSCDVHYDCQDNMKTIYELSLYEPELDIVAYDEEADRTVTIAIMCDDLTERERKFYAELIVKAVNSYEFS